MNEGRYGMVASVLTCCLVGGIWGCGASKTVDPKTPSYTSSPTPTAMQVLDQASMRAYHDAISEHLRTLCTDTPLVLNDFLGMTLYRQGGVTERFDMQKRSYFLMARSSHPPLALYAILRPGGFGPLTENERGALREYRDDLTAAAAEIESMDLDAKTTTRSLTILARSKQFADDALRKQSATREEFQKYAESIRPLVQMNLERGAQEQLEQFKMQMERWEHQFPNERWDQLRVVVLGFHEARDLYTAKLFFRWLLQEPAAEKRVVYAEVLIPPFGDMKKQTHDLALELLSKVDFEQEAAALILGDDSALKRDVMGPAAQKIIESWGPSRWP